MPTDTSFVRPNVPLVPETVKLSPIDQFTIRVFTPTLVCFKTEPGAPEDTICSVLKQSLANVLDNMYFLAGKIRVADKTPGTVELSVSEDDAVLFNVHTMRGDEEDHFLDLDELARDHFPPSRLDPAVLLPGSVFSWPVAACMAVQVNFIRGGLILAANIHHSVVDGSGIGVVLKYWARQAAAISQGLIVPTSETFARDALDRWPLFPVPGMSPAMSEYPGFTNKGVAEYFRTTEGLTISCWRISPANIRNLVGKVRTGDVTDKPGTESSVISAFLLRYYTKARRLDERGVTTVSAFASCDARTRMEPPLHPDYPGNVVVHSQATFPLAQVLSPCMDSLGDISLSIMESIEWWTPERVRQLLSSMQTHPRVGDVSRSMDLEADTCLEVSNVGNMQLYSTFWGNHLGNPCSLRLPYIPVLDGQIKFMPRLPDGGLELMFFMHKTPLERLKGDLEFTKCKGRASAKANGY
ncbi:transferase family-domain-containing protein [Aspergillus aurantiobrunneus]